MMNGRIDQVSKRIAAVARSRELNHKQDQPFAPNRGLLTE